MISWLLTISLDAELNDEIDEQVSNGCWSADQSNHIILFPVKEPVLQKDAVVQFDYWVPMEGTYTCCTCDYWYNACHHN